MAGFVGHKVNQVKRNLDDVEGGETADVRVRSLISYVKAQEWQIERLICDNRFKRGPAQRLAQAKRGGGRLNRLLKVKDDAVLVELTRYKRTGELIPPIVPVNDTIQQSERSDVDQTIAPVNE